MVAPAVGAYYAGAWAFGAWRAYRIARALQAAEALATATAAATSIESAQDDAEATPVPAVEACSNCQPPECGPKNDEIRALRNELEGRSRDMRIDRFDLFNQAFSRSNPMYSATGARIGSWEGHIDQFRQKQSRLRRLISEARAAGCDITTPDADRWGSIDPPSRPG